MTERATINTGKSNNINVHVGRNKADSDGKRFDEVNALLPYGVWSDKFRGGSGKKEIRTEILVFKIKSMKQRFETQSM